MNTVVSFSQNLDSAQTAITLDAAMVSNHKLCEDSLLNTFDVDSCAMERNNFAPLREAADPLSANMLSVNSNQPSESLSLGDGTTSLTCVSKNDLTTTAIEGAITTSCSVFQDNKGLLMTSNASSTNTDVNFMCNSHIQNVVSDQTKPLDFNETVQLVDSKDHIKDEKSGVQHSERVDILKDLPEPCFKYTDYWIEVRQQAGTTTTTTLSYQWTKPQPAIVGPYTPNYVTG